MLGEASDFDRDELNRLIDQRPELAALKQEIERVHGLLRDIGAGEWFAEDDDWKLSAEKRKAVLATISGETPEQPALKLAGKSVGERGWNQRRILGNIAKIAAVLLVAAFFGSMAIPSLRTARHAASKQLGLALHNYHSKPSTRGMSRQRSVMDQESAPAANVWMTDGAVMSIESDEQHLQFEEEATAESNYGQNSKSALSAIRESLGAGTTLPSPYYLQDDVQYFPAQPSFGVPQAAPESAEQPAAERRSRAPKSAVNGPGPGLRTADDLALPEVAESSTAEPSKTSEAGRATEDASQGVAGVALGDRPVGEAQAERPELAAPVLDFWESGQGQASSRGQPLSGGTSRRFRADAAGDSSVAEEDFDIDGIVQDGDSQDGEDRSGARLRIDRIAGTDARGAEAEPTPAEIVEREWGGSFGGGKSWNELKSGKDLKSKPMVAGNSGSKSGAEIPNDHDLYANSDIALPSITSPTGTPKSSTEDLKKKGVAEGVDEEFAKESLETLSDEVAALDDSRSLNGVSNGRQIPMPVTGTAIGQPGGGLQAGQAKQDQAWSYNGQVMLPQGGPAGLNKRVEDAIAEAYRNDAETYWERLPVKQKAKQGQLGPQKDQLAANEQARKYRYLAPKFTFESRYESKTRAAARKSVAPADLNEKTAQQEAFSTFSLHVSDVSFKLARAALGSGSWPDPAKLRIEEFVNALDYGDPMPSHSEKVACRVEQSVHPFLQQRNLLRVSMRTAAAGRSSNTPLRLTLLVDNSGSMERIDRQQTVRRAFALLAGQLKPIDQVTLISFARQPRLLADKVSGAQSQQLVQIIENLPSEGGTNIEAALQLAFEKAREHRVENAQNRIILLTDGAVNLGDADPESLSRMITTMRGAGIAFDAAGISAEGLNDEILEALTRQGDGRYYLLDSLEAADDGFARQIAGALRPSAKNVKVQIEFNPKRVGRYKLLGFEKHRLNKEDFRDDKVDAAEMAAAEAGVAVYQFEAKPDGEGDVGSVSVRFRDLSTGQMIENCWPIPYQADAQRLDQAAPSLRIAASAALLAAKLRGEPLGETVDLKTLSNLIAGLPDRDRNPPRVGELQQMIAQARQLSGK